MVRTHNPLGAPVPGRITASSGGNPAAGSSAGARTSDVAEQNARTGGRGLHTPPGASNQAPFSGATPNANLRGQGFAPRGNELQPQSGAAATPAWRRFGGGEPSGANPALGQSQGPTNVPEFNPQGNRPVAGQSSPAPLAERPAPKPMIPHAPNEAAAGAGAERSGWQHFGSQTGPTSPANTPRQAAPIRSAPGWSSRPAPQAGQAGQGGWQRFSPSRPAGPAPSASSAYRQEPSVPARAPGWNPFSPRSPGVAPRMQQNQGWSSAAPRGMGSPRAPQGSTYQPVPRSYSRPPLNINRPIVTPRSAPSPRSYGGGGSRGGSWGGAGGGDRSYGSGGRPSGGGRGRR
jgi:hypothetical protein